MRRVAKTLGLIGGLVVSGVSLVGVAVLVGWRMDADTGSYAEWLAAVSTLAAVLAAVYAGVQGARSLKIETDRDFDRDLGEKMRQARHVAVWVPGPVEWQGALVTHSWQGDGPVDTTVGDEPPMPVKMQVQARNASGLPVFNLTADFYVRAAFDAAWVLAVACPVCPFLLEDQSPVEIFSQRLSVEVKEVVRSLPGSWSAEGRPQFAVGWSFTDAAGVRWTRGPGQPLRPVSRPS